MSDSHDSVRWPLFVLAGICLVVLGVVLGQWMQRVPEPPPAADMQAGMDMTAGSMDAAMDMSAGGMDTAMDMADHEGAAPMPAEVVVTLTPEMAERAGIRTTPAAAGTAAVPLRMPGIVQPNGYKEVAVTSLVSGRVLEVHAELGQQVMTGDTLVTVYSPELADAQIALIVARAHGEAHGQKQVRTQRLTATGAASREELEAEEAERAMHDGAVESATTELVLLGIPEERAERLAGPDDVVATSEVPAPLDGVVTERTANPGLNIDQATPLLTVVDLSTVWVIADLYERDFAKVQVGSTATVTSTAYPGLEITGQVSYIDPQLQPETRTARLRVEVPNPDGQLRFGMYVDVNIGESVRDGVFVPTAAVQTVGSESVVYLAADAQPGRFIERTVEVGGTSDGRILVLSGLQPGDSVVTEGAFFVRAERERLQGQAPR